MYPRNCTKKCKTNHYYQVYRKTFFILFDCGKMINKKIPAINIVI